MKYGITVKNDVGHLLISSEFESLHCAGRATYEGVVEPRQNDIDRELATMRWKAGKGWGKKPIPDWANIEGLTRFIDYKTPMCSDDGTWFDYQGGNIPSNRLRGRRVHRFSIPSNAAPLFFIKPHPNAIGEKHGIIRQWSTNQGGKTVWYVEVIHAGATPYAPTVLSFVFLSDIPANYQDGYGIVTYLSDKRRAFDSRAKPLAVLESIKAISPEIPCNDGKPAYTNRGNDAGQKKKFFPDKTLDFDFNCNRIYNTYLLSSNVNHNDLMFSAPSVAQAVYSRLIESSRTIMTNHGSSKDTKHHWSRWWAMYHQAFSLHPNSIQTGWVMYANDYDWANKQTGGTKGGAGLGRAPFIDKTINLQPNTIIIADARPYL